MNINCNTTFDNKNMHPYIANIHQHTLENNNFRIALWTGDHIQMTLMCIPPCEEIGFEVHENLDQFIRIEKGQAVFKAGECMHHITYQKIMCENDGVFIPAGYCHNIINTQNEPLKLSVIYSSPNHPANILQPVAPK